MIRTVGSGFIYFILSSGLAQAAQVKFKCTDSVEYDCEATGCKVHQEPKSKFEPLPKSYSLFFLDAAAGTGINQSCDVKNGCEDIAHANRLVNVKKDLDNFYDAMFIGTIPSAVTYQVGLKRYIVSYVVGGMVTVKFGKCTVAP